MMVCRQVGKVEEELNLTWMDTRADSLKEKTREGSSVTCVGRSAGGGRWRRCMWKISTFREVLSTSVTNVIKSLAQKTSGPSIVRLCTPRSQSEKHFSTHVFSKLNLENLSCFKINLQFLHISLL